MEKGREKLIEVLLHKGKLKIGDEKFKVNEKSGLFVICAELYILFKINSLG